MNCVVHQNVGAVAQCGKCGAGICPRCESQSAYRLDNKPLCPECNYNTIFAAVKRERRNRVRTIIRLVFGVIFVWFGAWYLLNERMFIEIGIFFIALSGVPTAWRLTSPDARQRWRNDVDDAVSDVQMPFGGLLGKLIRFVFRLAMVVVIAVIAAPVLIVVNIVKIFKQGRSITRNKKLLENY